MAIRFRKSVKLAPGIRMNLSGSGLSWTLGPRGASIGIGKRGTYLNSSVAGFSSRQALTSRTGAARAKAAVAGQLSTKVALTVAIADDGTITFTNSSGQSVSEHLISQAKKQQGDAIRALIQSKCDEINAQLATLGELHHDTPKPTETPTYQPSAFGEPPAAPRLKVPGFFEKLFKGAQIQAQNVRAKLLHEAAVRQWEEDRAAFDSKEKKKQELVSRATAGDPEAMELFFGEVLQDIVWPRETLVSFEVRDQGAQLCFDVDLPEVEHMPHKTASVPQRGYKLTVKEMSATAVQKLYAQHVHSIAFRLLGEAFAMLPTVQEATLSAFSQRKSKATGHEADEYILSVVATRQRWQEINFSDLPAIDVIQAFDRFELRRSMTKTGVFTPIQPF